MSDPADRHRRWAATFTDRVVGTSDWEVPTPVLEWTARDVVRHLVEWLPGFLQGGSSITLPSGPSIDDDPLAAWTVHRDGVQAVLDDPHRATQPYRSQMFGEVTVADAISQFYTPDVFMHTWDLARATGQDDRLDEATCAEMLEGMSQMEDALRASGQFGTRQPVADDASVQDRFIAFIGRDPGWRPPG